MPNALSYLLVSLDVLTLSRREREKGEQSQKMHDDMMTHAFLSLEHDYVLRFLLVLVLWRLSSSLSRETEQYSSLSRERATM
jgi:hypothetical protein